MAQRRPVPAAVIVLLAGMLAACGNGEPPGGSKDGNAKDTPEALWAAYISSLAKNDADAVCKLFTGEGARTFADAWGAGDCGGAAEKAVAKLDDPATFAANHHSPHTKNDKQNFVEMTDCGVGALTAEQSDHGWLISGYRHPQTIGYCGG